MAMWSVDVPEYLSKGENFQLCQDTSSSSLQSLQNCLVKVDKDGFFLSWKSEEREGQVIDCGQLREVRTGLLSKDSKIYATLESANNSYSTDGLNDRIVSLCSGPDNVNVSAFNLLAKDAETAKKWVDGLRKIAHCPQAHNLTIQQSMKKQWRKICACVNRNSKIPVRSVTRPFLAGKSSKVIYQFLNEVKLPNGKNDSIDVSDFTFERYSELCKIVTEQREIKQLFQEICQEKEYISIELFIKWLNDNQRDPRLNEILFPMFDNKSVQIIISTHEPNKTLAAKGLMSFEGFYLFMTSEDNSVVFVDQLKLKQDMNQPLSHYFINSSHNTYLSGRQFGSKSSVNMYKYTLLAGCRCVELDCWDGKDKYQGEPIITHGLAMCTDILFRDVIVAIKDTAFVTSEYPVILSFENHCSKQMQLKMAKYCEDIFGDLLLKKPMDNYPLNPNLQLPSPNELKYKIIIKNKRLKQTEEKAQLERYFRQEEVPDDNPNQISRNAHNTSSFSAEEAHPELTRVTSEASDIGLTLTTRSSSSSLPPQEHAVVAKSESNRSTGSVFIDEDVTKKSVKKSHKKGEPLTEEDEKELLRNYEYTETSSTNIHPLLSSFVNYCQSVKFQGFKYSEEQKLYYQMSSFSESSGVSSLKTSAIEFVNYNKRQLSRIYPRGNRVDSSNYLPQIFWNAGCQMVSLNFQTSDLSMQLNNGKFEYNGACGYILKPEIMRRNDKVFDPFSESPVDGVVAAHCSVQVISGLFVSDKQIGTYVEVDMYGLPTDTIRKEHRTKVVYNNGLNPMYNSEPMVFRKVIMPHLALMRFAVHDENGKLLLQRVIPLDALQCGYRYITMKSPHGVPNFTAAIFCHIVLKSYVPDGMSDFVDALADPKKYLAIEDLRAKQMREMGIDEPDLMDEDSKTTNNTISKKNKSRKSLEQKNSHEKRMSTSGQQRNSESGSRSDNTLSKRISKTSHQQYLPSSGHLQQQNPVKDLLNRDPVTIKKLHSNPSFTKLVAQQEMELVKFRKKSDKAYQKIEDKRDKKLKKLISKLEKDKNSSSLQLLRFLTNDKKNVYKVTDDIKSRIDCLNGKEKHEAEALLESYEQHANNHLSEKESQLSDIIKSHQEKQEDALCKILKILNDTEIEKVKEAQRAEMQKLTEHQTKSSMKSTKGINDDKSIKNRAEKDRRIREMSSSNAKRFMEERQMMTQRHARELDALNKDQEKEASMLKQEIKAYVEDNLKRSNTVKSLDSKQSSSGDESPTSAEKSSN